MRFSPGFQKLIIASVDDNGSEMYYYGYGKMEHMGGFQTPHHTMIEWAHGSVRRTAIYPKPEDFDSKELPSGTISVETRYRNSLER